MAVINQSRLQWLAIVILFAISGLALYGDRVLLFNSSTNQLAAAKQKWVTQAVEHYRLSINYFHLNCQQEVEIKDEKVIGVRKNTCSTIPVQTITDLFNQIKSKADGKECGPNGCACDGPLGVDAIYDDQFGYPRQVEIRLQPEKRWLYFNSLNDIFPGRMCTAVGFIDQKITVREFSPIQ